MDKFDRYYKSRNLKVDDRLINTYVKYDDKTLLISNGFSIVYTKTIRNDFKENTMLSDRLIDYYKHFNDCEYVDTISLDTIKNNLDKEKYYIIDNKFGKYSIDYVSLKKIVDIIGYKRIEIVSNKNSYVNVFKIIGKNDQVGYLLPCRVY